MKKLNDNKLINKDNELDKPCNFCNEIDVNMKDIIICDTCKDHIIKTSKELKYWIPTFSINESQAINYIVKEMNYKIDTDIIKSILRIKEDYLTINRWLFIVRELKREKTILDYMNTDGDVLLEIHHNNMHKVFAECDK